MPDTWITDMTHYLDEHDRFATMPGPARRIADHLGAIVASATRLSLKAAASTGVRCRRRPGHRRCVGEIMAVFDAETNIVWECPSCGDNGLIHNWQGTPWDCRGQSRLH